MQSVRLKMVRRPIFCEGSLCCCLPVPRPHAGSQRIHRQLGACVRPKERCTSRANGGALNVDKQQVKQPSTRAGQIFVNIFLSMDYASTESEAC